MKPPYRSHTPAALPGGAPLADYGVTRAVPREGLLGRLRAWWRAWQDERETQRKLQALAPLDAHALYDIGVSEELRSQALAQRESQYERVLRSLDESRGLGSHFGPW